MNYLFGISILLCLISVTVALPMIFEKHVDQADALKSPAKLINTDKAIEHFSQRLWKLSELEAYEVSCWICQVLVDLVQTLFRQGKTEDEIAKEITRTCILFKIQDQRVCEGIVKAFKVEVLTVVGSLVLSPSEFCGIVIGSSCGSPYNPLENWNVTLPDTPKPPVEPPQPPKPGSPILKVLHISDIHVDNKYTVGNNAECNEPLCCRTYNGPPKPGSTGAGKWGDYRYCDSPLWTLENLFQHLQNKSSEFDYIMWTGDLPAHNDWDQTREGQTALIEQLTQLFLKYFPDKIIYSALGNHESSPVNSFPPPFIKNNNSITWLYEAVAKSWLNWLPQDTNDTIIKGSYYTVSPSPGFRIVSINSNYCNNRNWWLLLNTTDPAGQLEWLVHVLEMAEVNKEKVHILGHIPPGSNDCLKAWSWNYFKIINRFESTIAAQFFGHTHKDEFEVFYDDVHLARPVSIAYIGPSITPYNNLNFGYRIYHMDGFYANSSWAVLDHDTYIMNITESNLPGNEPRWELEYTAKEAYNMSSLYPEDWSDLIYKMKNDTTLFNKFRNFYFKSHSITSCDDKCRTDLLCKLKSGRSHDAKQCSDLLS